MATAKLAYQTRFSVPNQLDTPQASFGHFGTLPPHAQTLNAQHQIKQAEVTRLNAPVSKVLANFDQKAEQLRTFYESTNNQVMQKIPRSTIHRVSTRDFGICACKP